MMMAMMISLLSLTRLLKDYKKYKEESALAWGSAHRALVPASLYLRVRELRTC